jgi:restriction system protein
LVFDPPEGTLFINSHFPTEEHFDEYLSRIEEWSETDVIRLLVRFLTNTGENFLDKINLSALQYDKVNNPGLFRKKLGTQYYRRLIMYSAGRSPIFPWQGNTWILDLLPHYPKQALDALQAYFLAHAQLLPDGKMIGMYHAEEIIRAKFIGLPGTYSETIHYLLANINPRDFECLIERLYHEMGYTTELTPSQKDGGMDVIATRQTPGQRERLLVECKLYAPDNLVGVEIVRALQGVVFMRRVNKGVIVTTSRFSEKGQENAREWAEDSQIELISGSELIPLMNQHLGARWPSQIERLITNSLQHDRAQKQTQIPGAHL